MNTSDLEILSDGTQPCHLPIGLYHREDGPVYISPYGDQYWFLNNKLHRKDGPAIITASGRQSWYLNNTRYINKKEYQAAANLSDEDMTLLLLKYNFK